VEKASKRQVLGFWLEKVSFGHLGTLRQAQWPFGVFVEVVER